MHARGINLLLAAGLALLTAGLAAGNWRNWDATASVFLLFVACWLAGAIGLFFGGRLAWWSSLLCVGVAWAYSLNMVWVAWGLIRLQGDREPSASYGFTQMTCFLGLCILILTSATVVGLLRMRKEMAGKWK